MGRRGLGFTARNLGLMTQDENRKELEVWGSTLWVGRWDRKGWHRRRLLKSP